MDMSLEVFSKKSLGELVLGHKDFIQNVREVEIYFIYDEDLYKLFFDAESFKVCKDQEILFSETLEEHVKAYILMHFHDAEIVEDPSLGDQITLEIPTDIRPKTIEMAEKVRDEAADLLSSFLNGSDSEE